MNPGMRNPVFVALDMPTKEAALTLAHDLAPVVGGFKIGSELFTSAGPEIVRAVRAMGAAITSRTCGCPRPNWKRRQVRRKRRSSGGRERAKFRRFCRSPASIRRSETFCPFRRLTSRG